MKRTAIILYLVLLFILYAKSANAVVSSLEFPIGSPGLSLTYMHTETGKLPESVVRKINLTVGGIEERNGVEYQWLQLNAEKENKQKFSVWMLSSGYPSDSLEIAQENALKYILSKTDSNSVEFVHQNFGFPVLPNIGAWKYLLPKSEKGNTPLKSLANKIEYLGHEYQLADREQVNVPFPPNNTIVVKLLPELIIGVPHNTKQKDETRRYDRSDYDYVQLTKSNYSEMINAGINCFRVNAGQATWIETKNVYYWGIGGEDVLYPECLYQSNYIGPVLFFDEPMVGTRDHVLRPRLKEDPMFRKTITPSTVFKEFTKLFQEKKYKHGPTQFLQGLNKRKDVDIGNMDFLQQNMYTWETMISSAFYQLSEGGGAPPYAMVFEPPGRFGTRRVLPELNMCFDCQIPTSDPKNLSGIIYGFLRGASRVTQKEWGVSIYGHVDLADTFWFMTHAYDQGASLFHYWDTFQLAAVPYHEYLALSQHLRAHAKNFPKRNMEKLRNAAEIAILIPPGYNLGHVKIGIGNISGLPELNMERKNSHGVKYREVMNNFYIEIERCIRLGVEYDLFWNMENLRLRNYREIVMIRQDGKVDVIQSGKTITLNSARRPSRPDGVLPQLLVDVELREEKIPFTVIARAKVTEGSAPIFYTQGADNNGIYNNQYVLWELFGPNEHDYSDLWLNRWDADISENGSIAEIEIKFTIDEPGDYRLRAATSDAAGRSRVIWKEINIAE